MTTPDAVRADLTVVTDAAKEDLRTVASSAPQTSTGLRAALFAAAPLIVDDYASGAASLALDWYEELREAASPTRPFRPSPLVLVTDEDVAAAVAATTKDLAEIERQVEADFEAELAKSLALLEAEIQKDVASGFRDTVTGNTADDPDAVGWQRHARPGACKFCLMLADRGAVFTEASVRFAAHTDCGCVVGPGFDPDAPKADVMQYLASKRERTAKERAALRKYLNANYPDAHG